MRSASSASRRPGHRVFLEDSGSMPFWSEHVFNVQSGMTPAGQPHAHLGTWHSQRNKLLRQFGCLPHRLLVTGSVPSCLGVWILVFVLIACLFKELLLRETSWFLFHLHLKLCSKTKEHTLIRYWVKPVVELSPWLMEFLVTCCWCFKAKIVASLVKVNSICLSYFLALRPPIFLNIKSKFKNLQCPTVFLSWKLQVTGKVSFCPVSCSAAPGLGPFYCTGSPGRAT